jgi:hypothetical protein
LVTLTTLPSRRLRGALEERRDGFGVDGTAKPLAPGPAALRDELLPLSRVADAHTTTICLADGDRTDTGHYLALRQVTVADDTPVAVRGLQIGMLAEKVRDLGLDRLSHQSTRPIGRKISVSRSSTFPG